VLKLAFEVVLDAGLSGLVRPAEPHLVELLGPMRMQVEFSGDPKRRRLEQIPVIFEHSRRDAGSSCIHVA
jgi:hypothetical protein